MSPSLITPTNLLKLFTHINNFSGATFNFFNAIFNETFSLIMILLVFSFKINYS